MLTRSMKVVLHDLRLDRLLVVHPGASGWRLDERTEALPLAQLRGVLGVGG